MQSIAMQGRPIVHIIPKLAHFGLFEYRECVAGKGVRLAFAGLAGCRESAASHRCLAHWYAATLAVKPC